MVITIHFVDSALHFVVFEMRMRFVHCRVGDKAVIWDNYLWHTGVVTDHMCDLSRNFRVGELGKYRSITLVTLQLW